MRYRRELYDQKIIFMRFLKIIRTLSGCYAQKKYLMKVAHPEDNMYRVVQKHIFIYRGGLAEFDEKIREHEEKLPIQVILYSDENRLYIADCGILTGEETITPELLNEYSAALLLHGIQIPGPGKKMIEPDDERLNNLMDDPVMEFGYSENDVLQNFEIESYIWNEKFLNESVGLELNDINDFMDRLIGKSGRVNSNLYNEATMAEFKGGLEIIFDKFKKSAKAS